MKKINHLDENHLGFSDPPFPAHQYLKASPLPPAPLAVEGFLVARLVAWQYSILIGLLACWPLRGFAAWFFVFLALSVGVFAGSLVSRRSFP